MLRNLRILCLSIIYICITSFLSQGQKTEDAIDSIVAGITSSIYQVTPLNTTFSYAVIKDGVPRFYGFKNAPLKQLTTIENKDAVFEIGSISKVFTSILLADLLEKKQVNTSTTLEKYFNNKMKAGNDITLIQLANHSSRMPRLPDDLPLNITNPYKDYSYWEIGAYLREQLVLQDSAIYEYSNLGVAVLEYCIAMESKQSYESYLRKVLFLPLQMTHSSTITDWLKADLVQGQDSAGIPCPTWEMNGFIGAGGVKSSVNDLSKLVMAYFNDNNPILNRTLEPTLEVNAKMFMGLGWHGIKVKDETIWYFHNGGTNGYGSTILMDVKKKNAVIILSNLSAFNPYFPYIDKAAINIMNVMNK